MRKNSIMNPFHKAQHLMLSGFSSQHYYEKMNDALIRLNNEQTMLHYPYYGNLSDDFLQSQKNLTDHCLHKLGSLRNKSVLEIGCGNGVQTYYIFQKYKPSHITGIDLNPGNIAIAKQNRAPQDIRFLEFSVDDAQTLRNIKSNTIDVVLNIESAFHYPNKKAFLKEIHRVLRPGGQFLIADILTKSNNNYLFKRRWKKKMSLYHWHQEDYEYSLPASKLKITQFEDITQKVIQSFKNYRSWIDKMKKKRFLEDLIFKLFFIINARLNIILLQKRRKYIIFVGERVK